MENNEIELIGKAEGNFEYLYSAYGENFYSFIIAVERTSGYNDRISCICSDRVIDITKDVKDSLLCITGSVRTFNLKDNERTHLKINVYVDEMEIVETQKEHIVGLNSCCITGYICKKSEIRQTPLGRTILDFTIASNRAYGKSDYIPVIAWNKNAKYLESLPVGEKVKVFGRLQSREYTKEEKVYTAYELSLQTIELLDQLK